MEYTCLYQSAIGILELHEEEKCITGLHLYKKIQKTAEKCRKPVYRAEGEETKRAGNRKSFSENASPTPLLAEACQQLDGYFSGKRKVFDLPLKFHTGTEFQQKVWSALCEIPYGETRSYADIAVAVGNPKAVRAIGQANTRNPIMIFVPCHRVINKNGLIGGFGCGVDVKRLLLELEGVHL